MVEVEAVGQRAGGRVAVGDRAQAERRLHQRQHRRVVEHLVADVAGPRVRRDHRARHTEAAPGRRGPVVVLAPPRATPDAWSTPWCLTCPGRASGETTVHGTRKPRPAGGATWS